MLKLLVPVDGSDASNRAIDHLIDKMPWLAKESELHLLNVQPPIPGGSRVAAMIGQDRLNEYHHDQGIACLKPAMQKLDAAGLKYVHHIAVGEPAQVIAEFAKEKGCDEIVMGTRGLGAPASLLIGSVATKVIHLVDIPVLLVK